MSDEQQPEEIDYDADQISVLEGLKAVRKRPGMYIGSTGEKGLHHMIWEVADNAIDEAMAGYCDEITIELLEDHWIRVSDNGRGIPVEEHEKKDMSAMEVVMTTLHAGGKFDEGGYKVSGGLHGVGVSVVNALSEEATATSYRNGNKWVQKYEQGKRQTDVEKKEKTDRTGTVIEFRPDPEIFDTLDFKWETILEHLRRQAYLTKGIHIKVNDKRTEEEKEQDETIEHQFDENKYQFYFEGGIKSYIKHINRNREQKHENIFYMDKEVDDIAIEVAFQYTDDSTESQHPFANNIATEDGGTHVSGFRRALTRTLNKYARKKEILDDDDDNFKGQDVREGLTSVVSVKIPEPQFEGQTKAKLGNPEVRSAVEKSFAKELMIYLEENPKDADAIMEKAMLAAKARRAAKTARESVLRKGALSGNLTLPGKLSDCSTRKAKDSELFIVEGDSAGGCFSADTKVALADGRNLEFKQIVEEQKEGKEHFCYTIRQDGKVGLQKFQNARVTKEDAEVIKVTLDNGEQITCTPDHEFMLRDGSYREAQNLKPKDSLMPLYRKKSDSEEEGITIDNYEMTWDPKSEKWLFTHKLADWYNLWQEKYKEKDGGHCHHIDFDKHNNNPTNIKRVSLEWRKQKTKKQWTEEFREKRKKALRETYYNKTLSKLKEFSTTDEINLKKYKEYRIETGDSSLLRFDTFCDRYFEEDESKAKEAVLNYNHEVKKVEKLNKKIDVYDAEVPGTHNFALASGVFVHNSAKQGRDRETQAILPLRGKVLNAERARIDKIVSNKELKSLIIALGTNIGEEFDIEELRYDKIVILTDADVDGAHIRTLLLTFFFRYFPKIIEDDHLFIGKPPLYSVKKGSKKIWLYSDEELEEYKREQGIEDDEGEGLTEKAKKKLNVQRYKGLGEMNPEELWETTMDPESRILKQVAVEDAEKASEVFDVLMGKEVGPRKKFILDNATEVENLDV
ncbi:MAG: DNA topoisomerase (ATP-hydrolyzing) subunit B [Candidatus Paceibacteria bacterium]